MKKIRLAILFTLVASVATAQTIIDRDPVIARAITEISADSLRATVADLVGFHTRHNLSTQTDPARGIGAAAFNSWLIFSSSVICESRSATRTSTGWEGSS